MKKQLLATAIIAAFGAPSLATAGEDLPISANITMTSDYLFRGLSQTDNKPALQGGFDYEHASGFYAGVWGSNVSWVGDADSSLEIDGYFGYTNELSNGLGYDVGFIHYDYPGEGNTAASADADEIYLGMSYSYFSGGYSYAISDDFFGFDNADGSSYFNLGANYTFEEPGITIGAHYGFQEIEGAANSGSDYEDYNISISKEFGGFEVAAMISDTDIDGDDTDFALSISRSF